MPSIALSQDHLIFRILDLLEARALLGPDAIIGVTCYGQIERAVAAVQEGADYVAFGTSFASPTKGTQGKTPLTMYREAKQHVAVPEHRAGRAVHQLGADQVTRAVAARKQVINQIREIECG